MPNSTQFVKPSKRAALRNAKSIILTIAVFSLVLLCFAAILSLNDWLEQFSIWTALLFLSGIAIVGSLILFAVAYAAQSFLPKRLQYSDSFGSLKLDGNAVVQFGQATEAARIDAAQPYEYQVLDRYDVKTAVFRLYQNGKTLTFRFSDPGAQQIVSDVMGLTWPPASRHAGRSYPPPAA